MANTIGNTFTLFQDGVLVTSIESDSRNYPDVERAKRLVRSLKQAGPFTLRHVYHDEDFDEQHEYRDMGVDVYRLSSNGKFDSTRKVLRGDGRHILWGVHFFSFPAGT